MKNKIKYIIVPEKPSNPRSPVANPAFSEPNVLNFLRRTMFVANFWSFIENYFFLNSKISFSFSSALGIVEAADAGLYSPLTLCAAGAFGGILY